ncbi:hypothetical protein BY458DRAFT_526546 [Sporodiniella umbellata]|nr:hypothetical protein BY458DRAFT_526546 [Sporodiniella umbellata]
MDLPSQSNSAVSSQETTPLSSSSTSETGTTTTTTTTSSSTTSTSSTDPTIITSVTSSKPNPPDITSLQSSREILSAVSTTRVHSSGPFVWTVVATSYSISRTFVPVPSDTALGQASDQHIGAIAGGVVGGVAFLSLLGGVLWCMLRKRKGTTLSPVAAAAEEEETPASRAFVPAYDPGYSYEPRYSQTYPASETVVSYGYQPDTPPRNVPHEKEGRHVPDEKS